MYNYLQLREIFHLEFLRWFGRKVKAEYYTLKGGVNLRFFFNSFRYSEDMDIDIERIKVSVLRDKVMEILESFTFADNFRPFGIIKIVSPDITKAKQTETTQRFKVHLITSAGEDLFTKVEFSRRGFKKGIIVEPVSNTILRAYKISPLLAPHYNIQSALAQKIDAIISRVVIQARDIFDFYILSSQYRSGNREKIKIPVDKLKKAYENIFEVSFEQFSDTVLSYLSKEDVQQYNSAKVWDEIKLKTADFIKELTA
ncbi:MAG: nucleotidyl transferase AbiEii/AbiGii toxin family protein [Candidatus Omnitrophota bacterium]|nr:nucleotidyl transferase AbiEii/AbiGii toxin family protein [Candidatus Omnitrophota bacterium]